MHFWVLEDVDIPLSMTTFFEYRLSIKEESYPDWVVTIKSVYFIWLSSSALYLLMFKRNKVVEFLWDFYVCASSENFYIHNIL